MSVINKMLQDLEKRRADVPVSGTGSNQVKAVPVQPKKGFNRISIWMLLIIAILIALILWQQQRLSDFRKSNKGALSLSADIPAAPASTPGNAQATAPVQSTDQPTQVAQQPAPPAAKVDVLPASPESQQVVKTDAPIETPAANANHVLIGDKSAKTPLSNRSKLGDNDSAIVAGRAKSGNADTPIATVRNREKKDSVNLSDSTDYEAPADTAVPNKPSHAQKLGAAVAVVPNINKQVRQLSAQQQADQYYRNAEQLLQQGRLQESKDLFKQALQSNPTHSGARQRLIAIEVESKNYRNAEQLAAEGMAADPKTLSYAMTLARLQVERQDSRGALDTMQRGLPSAGNDMDYHAFLAALLQRVGDHKAAVEHYLVALRGAPNSGPWLMGIGISLQAENRLADAQAAFQRAKTSNTLNPELVAFVDQRLKKIGQQGTP